MPTRPIAMKAITLPAVLAAWLGGPAAAQSNVALSGTVDLAVAHGSGSIASQTQLANGYLASSRIAFKGSEDLGGGLKAGFWIESGLNADTGTYHFDDAFRQLDLRHLARLHARRNQHFLVKCVF